MRRVLLGAALAAVILVPAASASRAHRVKFGVVVLPKSALGSAGRSLALSRNSGVVSNADASNNSVAGKSDTFGKLGRLTGYDLSYGDRYSGRPGVTEISTGVDEYKSATDARMGLAFWRRDDPKLTVLKPYGFPVSVKALQARKIGTHRFAEGTTITVPNAASLALVDEQFTDGQYVLRVDVAAGSLFAAARAASKLAPALDRRLRLAEAGKLRGKPVKLLRPVKAGPPSGGPDLATLALGVSDFGGQATILDHGYGTPSPPSLSEYELDLEPAGNFEALSQLVDWLPAANDATVLGRFEGAVFAYVLDQPFPHGTTGPFVPVDLSAVGDNAFGGTWSVTPPGQPVQYDAVVAFSSGQAASLVLAASQSPIQPADLVNLAQLAANRLDTGLAG